MAKSPANSLHATELSDEVIRLRPLEITDARDLSKSVDARMVEFTRVPVASPSDYTVEMAEEFIAYLNNHEHAVAWALTEPLNSGDRYCGNIEFRVDPINPHTGSLGYNSAPWARGRGLQSRAVRLATRYLFELEFHRVELRARVDNHASRWVAEKAQFTFEGYARGAEFSRGEYHDLAVYSALATDPAFRQ